MMILHALERVIGYSRVLEAYSDSNWISDANKIKATNGYVFALCGGIFFVSFESGPS
jgi:hypothetical protein